MRICPEGLYLIVFEGLLKILSKTFSKRSLVSFGASLPKSNITPEKLPKPKRKVVFQIFQPPFFRGYENFGGVWSRSLEGRSCNNPSHLDTLVGFVR